MYYLEVSDSWSRHCGQWLSKLEKSCIYWLPNLAAAAAAPKAPSLRPSVYIPLEQALHYTVDD